MTIDELRSVLADIEFQGWRFGVDVWTGHILHIRVEFDAFDNHDESNDEAMPQSGRWWRIEKNASRSDVVRTAWLAVMTAMEHEIREQFKYQGKAIFDPHFCVDCMVNADFADHPTPKAA